MGLANLVLIPLIGGVLAWLAGRRSASWARWVALMAMVAELHLVWFWWRENPDGFDISDPGRWMAEQRWPWVPQLGISLHLAMDGLSLLLVALTAFLGLVAVLASWNSIRERVGLFYLSLLLVLAGVVGVFLAADLFLFYFCWELMLVPMYFLIDLWGHENRHYAAVKFFLFTQLGGLLMLVAILALYFVHGRQTGVYTFSYEALLVTALPPVTARWLMLGFLAAFAVKLPVVPLHTWLPDAHTEAPTAGSVVLAGLLLKTGAYGMLRFVLPLFPEAVAEARTVMMVLAVAGILYGALLAFAQTDLKRLVAYTSVSHMGFVLLGLSAGNALGLKGAVVQMVAHGIGTGALFVLAGTIQDRLGTRDLERLGGLWSRAPALSAAMMVFALASLGLPGLGSFVGEFLVLLGCYQVSVPLAAVAAAGLVLATAYALRLVQLALFGEPREARPLPDLDRRELATVAAMVVVIVWLGLFPQAVLNLVGDNLDALPAVLPHRVSVEAAPCAVTRSSPETGGPWHPPDPERGGPG